MTELGHRSIEIQLANYLDTSVSVASSSADASWIDGEEASEGQVIDRDRIVVWGARTGNPEGSAQMTVALTGPRGGLTITATNEPSGKSSVSVSSVDPHIFHRQEPVPDSPDDHSRFLVFLAPN